ncbi:hypothetical protein [Methylobacterium sp. CM6244]
MRSFLPSLVAAALSFWAISPSSHAETPDELLNKTAKAAARVGGIDLFCRSFYLIDRVKVAELGDSIVQDGIRRFGKQAFSSKYKRTLLEYNAEVSQVGAAIWCPKQREHFQRIGVTGLIGGNLE